MRGMADRQGEERVSAIRAWKWLRGKGTERWKVQSLGGLQVASAPPVWNRSSLHSILSRPVLSGQFGLFRLIPSAASKGMLREIGLLCDRPT